MKHYLGILAITMLLVCASTTLANDSEGPDFQRWYVYNEAYTLAQEHERPLMLYFWHQHCHACHRLNAWTLSQSAVREVLAEDFVVATIDIRHPDNKAIVAEYRVRGTPTLVFVELVEGEARELQRYFSERPKEQFLDELTGILVDRSKLP